MPSEVRKVQSMTKAGLEYEVTISETGRASCTCPQWIYHRREDCKHIKLVAPDRKPSEAPKQKVVSWPDKPERPVGEPEVRQSDMAYHIWTIGHSNAPINKFLKLLYLHQIERVVDVRTKPLSRFFQFNQKALSKTLTEENIIYDWRGKNLGGLGENVDFLETIKEINDLAETKHERIALMCSEEDPAKCHRTETLQPEFMRLGAKFIHIRHAEAGSEPGSRLTSLPKKGQLLLFSFFKQCCEAVESVARSSS